MNINNINVNKYPVSQVFDPESKVIFEIPKYQREYTWGSREWEALFDDLVENDDGYFLGSINLTDIPPTRDLSRMFMAFIEEIEQNGYVRETIYSNLRYKLMDNSASDEIFEEKLRGPVYDDNSGATRFILCMMAKRSMTVENEKDLWRKTGSNQYVWSIEHIFPQGPNIPDEWVEMIAGGDREKAKEYQSLYVHTFGNLTITGYNSTLSNKAFIEKRERKDSNGRYIGYRNGLNLNDDVCDKDEWTVEIIKARTDRMVKEIMAMFAL